MSVKTVYGTYAAGYYLNPSFSGLQIGNSGYIGGTGVRTTATHASSVANLGTIHATGAANGITLSDGGSITNGSGNSIEAARPIRSVGATTITNDGKITSDGQSVYPGGQDFFTSVSVQGAATVTNKAGAVISNGIAISGAGTVVNDGTVGGAVYWGRSGYVRISLLDVQYFYGADNLPSVTILGGGKVTNGTGTDRTASLENGVYIGGGVGTVVNNGFIGGPNYQNYVFPARGGASVNLAKGGSVINGSATNSSATIGGTLDIGGPNGTVTNYGLIFNTVFSGKGTIKNRGTMQSIAIGSGAITNGGAITSNTSVTGTGTLTNTGMAGMVAFGGKGTVGNDGSMGAVNLKAGGRVTNGGTSDFAATITASGNGITVGTQAGTIANFGSIVSTTVTYGDLYSGIELDAGGTVTNGSASDRVASIAGIVGITLAGAGTVTNFGLVAGTGGTAIAFTSPSGKLVEEGGSTVDGAIVGSGGTVEFAANRGLSSLTNDVSGFKSITVDSKASWVLSGAATLPAANSLLRNAGTLTDNGQITLAGQLNNSGVLIDNPGSTMTVAGPAANSGTISNQNNNLSFAGPVTNSDIIANKDGVQLRFAGPLTNGGSISNNGTGTTVNFNGSVTNKGLIQNATAGNTINVTAQVTNSGTISNAVNSTIDLIGDISITNGTAKAGIFANRGTLEKTGGNGVSIIRTGSGALTDTGTIDVETGTIELTGAAPAIAGAITGGGTIEFGAGNTTLSASISTGGFAIAGTGAHVTSAKTLTYGGAFSATANAELTLSMPSTTWKLTGSANFSHATIDGGGTLVTAGTTSLGGATLGGNAQWENSGTFFETGLLTVAAGHSIAFTNETHGTFDLDGNVGITGTGTGAFDNAGLLAKIAGSTSTVAIAVTNTGTIEAASGTLDLAKAVTGTGGTLRIDSGQTLQADAAVSTGQTALFSGTGGDLTLTDAKDFHAKLSGFAATDKLDLTQFGAGTTLAYSGNTTQGTLTVTDGALQAKLALLGQYAAAGFSIGTDGHNGSLITYTPPANASLATDHLAPPTT